MVWIFYPLCCLVVLIGPQAVLGQDSCWDFTKGIPSNAATTGAGVNWARPLVKNKPCEVQGVLQFIPPKGATQLKVHMRIINGTGWQFNLGDSPTNNGHSGDGGSVPIGYNAEIQKLGNYFRAIRGISYPQPDTMIDQADLGPTHELTIRIKKGFIWATNYNGWMMSSCQNVHRLFSWDAIPGDAMYLGINRVIYSTTSAYVSGNRVGKGLCKLCIEWE